MSRSALLALKHERAPLPTDRLADAVGLVADDDDDPIRTQSLRRLDHVPDQMVKLGIDSQFTEAFSTSVWVYGQDAYHLTNDNATGRFGGYVLVNADLRYRWGRVTLGLHAKNLFDRYHEYVWHDGAQTLHSPGDGRTFLGTLSYAF